MTVSHFIAALFLALLGILALCLPVSAAPAEKTPVQCRLATMKELNSLVPTVVVRSPEPLLTASGRAGARVR